MVRSMIMLAIGCGSVLACSQELTMRERLVEEQVVEDRLDTWVRLLNNGRRDSIAAMYDPVAELRVLRADGRRSEGWEAEVQAITAFFDRIQYMNFVLSDAAVDVQSATLAITTFRHSVDIVDAGGLRPGVAAGQGTIVWVKDRGGQRWMIHTQHLSVNAPSVY